MAVLNSVLNCAATSGGGIERKIEIIGEAMNKILKILPDINFENARKVIDTRNWGIYGYDKVDDVIIWGIVVNHLPKLQKEIEEYLTIN